MLGEKLSQVRKSKGLTQEEVSKYLNVKRQTYSAYERNISMPDAETLSKLSTLYEVTTDYLLGKKTIVQKPAFKEIALSEKDIKQINEESNRLRTLMMASLGMAFDGQIEDEDTLEKVMMALEEGMIEAKKEAKEKYTPKKYRK